MRDCISFLEVPVMIISSTYMRTSKVEDYVNLKNKEELLFVEEKQKKIKVVLSLVNQDRGTCLRL